MGLSKS
jgi:hypothetical protein